MGGGPSGQQTAAANSQAQLASQMGNIFTQGSAQTQPFYSSMMQNGMPNYNNMTDAAAGNVAQSFAPAKAQLNAQLGQSANALPSGFATQARSDLAAQQAGAQDQSTQQAQQQNFQTKQQGAAGLNPLGYGGAALQGNQSIMGAPLATPGLAGLLGGIGGGLAQAIPF